MGKVTLFKDTLRGKKPWRAQYRDNGKSKACYFATKKEAENFQTQRAKESKDFGKLALTDTQRQEYWQARQICDKEGVELLKVVDAEVAILGEGERPKILLTKAIVLFLDDCEIRKLRPASVTNYRLLLESFAKNRQETLLNTIAREHLLTWIQSKSSNEHSRQDYRGILKNFFSWCAHQDRRWCSEAVVKDLTWRKTEEDEKRVGILTPKQAENLINNVQDNLKGAVALGLFAGIRPHELMRMEWRMRDKGTFYGVNYTSKIIHIAGVWAKTRRYRKLYDLPDNLWKWLRKHGAKKGQVVPMNARNFKKAMKNARTNAKIKYWPHDAMRHSFGSYGYHRGLEWCVDTMGHVAGLKTFQAHYKAATTKNESVKYFDITPS